MANGNPRKNGWWLFYSDSIRTASFLPGETNESRRQRVWKQCRTRWSGDGGVALKDYWKAQAIAENQRRKLEDSVVQPLPGVQGIDRSTSSQFQISLVEPDTKGPLNS